jgi:2-amino-4-hydroxy-6-hydroxymethyldihydropteridine diphosphokinase
MNQVIIGIGSNIDADKNIAQMLEILRTKVKVIKVSPMIRTSPIGIKDQPEYTNGAVKIETQKDRASLNRTLKKIEDKLGRDRSGPKFGPRTMDLDIVVWNGEIVDPDYYTRDFIRTSVKAIDKVSFQE